MFLNMVAIVVSVLLVAVILMQVQGSGLSGSFGGSNESFRSRRSMDKVLVYATVALGTIFALVSILLLISI